MNHAPESRDVAQYLSRWLEAAEPGSSLGRCWSLGGGISSGMTAFTVTGDGPDRTLILRQPNDWTLANIPQAVQREFQRLLALRQAGIRVPAAVAFDESAATFGRPGLVIEYVDGEPDLKPGDLSDHLDQLARQLAAIHQIPAATPGLGLPSASPAPFASFTTSSPPDVDPIYEAERVWMHLRPLGETRSTHSDALLHGDYWPGNTLWHEGSLVAVIDWEAATHGDPLKDLAICRLDLFWLYGKEAMAQFTDRYLAAMAIDPALLPAWDLVAALRLTDRPEDWAASYAPLERPDVDFAYMHETYTDFVEQAFMALGRSGL